MSQAKRLVDALDGVERADRVAWLDFVTAYSDRFWSSEAKTDDQRESMRRALSHAMRAIERSNVTPFERCCSDLVRVAYATPTMTEGLDLLRFALVEACRAGIDSENVGLLWYRYAQRMDLCSHYLETFRLAAEVMAEAAGKSKAHARATAPVLTELARPSLGNTEVSIAAAEEAYRWTFALAGGATRKAAIDSFATFRRRTSGEAAAAEAASVADTCHRNSIARGDALYSELAAWTRSDAPPLPAWAAGAIAKGRSVSSEP